ncbi:MAG: cytochrome C oxidase subunit IV family protein [Deltaproteobacteria bacterium]|nr:cytochrome C oxidase subunit IV family protein [Deltaproteobacteria bacterium]
MTEHAAPHAHVVPLAVYFGVFIALLVFTGATTAIAFVDLGRFNVAVALTIAVVKASLVLLYFMHLRYTSRLTLVFVGIAFFWLGTMIGLTMSDIVSRGWFGA